MSVAEFARSASIDKREVYKRIDKELAEYIKKDNGRIEVSADALKFFDGSVTTSQLDTVSKKEEPPQETTRNDKETVKSLEATIAEKSNQISLLQLQNEKLEEQKKESKELTDKLLKLLEQEQELNRNSQLLLAQSQEQVKRLEAPQADKRSIFNIFKRTRAEQ